MVITIVIAWSFWISALNISPIPAVCISAVDFSLIPRQVITINTTKIIATISEKYLKPYLSTSLVEVNSPVRLESPPSLSSFAYNSEST